MIMISTDGLARESVNKLAYILCRNTINAEDTSADTNTVLTGGGPVELLHTTITDKWSVQCGEIVTSDDDGDTGVLLLVVHTGELHVGGSISNVHEGGVHHLVVNCVLCGSSHTTRTSIKIVDEQAAHLSLPDNVSSLTVPLPDQLGWFSCVSTFQFSSTHHDWAANKKFKITSTFSSRMNFLEIKKM